MRQCIFNGQWHAPEQDVLSSGSYISSNDRRLGDATDAGTVEVHRPSGNKETIKLPAVDRNYTITEGKGITGALYGGKPCDLNAAAGMQVTDSQR